jgi:bacterioferritin-associated ferredoxin
VVLILILNFAMMGLVLVCHCHGITESRIRQIARAREPKLREIARSCGAGTGCGGCRPAIRQILADEKASRAVCEDSAPAPAAALPV